MLMARPLRRSTALIASESTLILAAVVATDYVRQASPTLPLPSILASGVLPKALLIVIVCQVCLYLRDLYEGRVVTDSHEVLVRLFQGLGVTSIVLAMVYSRFPELMIGRGVFVAAVALVAVVIAGWRTAIGWADAPWGPRERLLIVGTNPSAVALGRELWTRRDLGVEIVGFVDPDGFDADVREARS